MGTNTISLTGTDADSFEVDGNVLYLKANTTLDYETKNTYNVTAQVQDSVLGATPVTTDFTLNVTDINEAGMTVTPTTGTTTEAGGTSDFTVVLNAQPKNPVTIKIDGIARTEGKLSTSSLTFTPSNWNTPQTVTVTGVDDNIIDGNKTYTLNLTSTSSDSNFSGLNKTVNITNTDNDTAGITVTPDTGSTTEAEGQTTFTVALTAQPNNPVTIKIEGIDSTEGTLSTNSLSFDNSNWNTAQTVTVTGVDDSIVDSDITYPLTLTASSSDNNFNNKTATVNITNTDNDTRAIIVTPSTVTTTEAGGQTTFTVALNALPSNDVTINITGLDTTEGTLSTNSLTFTPSNWNTAQTVTVTGVDDVNVDSDITYPLTLTSSDNNYQTATVNITNTDNDTAGITVNSSTVTTTEAGGQATFTVVLNTAPSDTVTINITGDDTEGSLDKSSLTFTPSNWNTAQTVIVTGVDDNIVDGNQRYILNLRATSTDNNYNNQTATVNISNTDNDTAGITVTPTRGSTTEAGGTSDFTFSLNSQPESEVTINFTSNNQSEGTLSRNSLTFDHNNWDTPQTLRVTGTDDRRIDGNINYTITSTISTSDSNYKNVAVENLTITNTDDDTAGITVTSPTDNTTEAGGTSNFTVALTAQPSNQVTVNITGLDSTEGRLSTNSLTFNRGNWNTPQTVTVTGVDDKVVDGNQTYTLNLTASGDSNFNNQTRTVNITNTDNDTAGITLDTTTGTTREIGTSINFKVALGAQPENPVTINITGLDSTEGRLSTNSLTFNSSNWDKAQTVIVTGVNDQIDDDNQTYTLTLTSSGDSNFAGLTRTIDITNLDDNDTAGITVTPTNGTTTEAGGSTEFVFTLTSEPTQDVTIEFPSHPEAQALLPLTFTSGNWNTPQTLTVTGADDTTQDGDQTYTLTPTVTTSDVKYQNVNRPTLTITNKDNDAAGITVNTTTVTTTEIGGSTDFEFRVNTQPTSNITINFANVDSTEGTISTNSLTFTTTDWNQPKFLTVTSVNDDLVDGDITYSITTTVSTDDNTYKTIKVPELTIINTNDDYHTYSVTTASSSINEGNSGSQRLTFTVTRTNTSGVSSVGYVIAGNATLNSDYNNIRVGGVTGGVEGVINFSTGENSKAITLDVLGDTQIEANETIDITLRNPLLTSPESIITTNRASITITNDDVPLIGNDLTGTNGNDTLRGTTDDDTIRGMGGNDRLLGFAGNDTLIGGPGADIVTGKQIGRAHV